MNITTGTGVSGTTQQTFEYDLMSRIIKTKDISPTGVNVVEHQYNSLNRLLSENLKIGDSDPRTTSKEYTKVGRVSKLTYPSGRVNTYTYDDNYLPQTIISNGEVVASYEFNAINAPTKKTLGNQVSLEIEYNTRQQATKHVWKQNGNTISGYHYGYDLVGNRIWSENQTDSQKSEHFTFDSIDRLTNYQKGTLNANQTGTVSPTYFQNWNLDNIGNWKLFDDNGVSSTNQFNQVHAMTEFKGQEQTFDANGNLISDGVRSFIYDAFNRLLEVKIGDTVIAQYQYDTYNRRVSKTTNAGTTHYLYDGFRCIEERNENGILEKEYIHGGLYIDEVISQISNAETYYFTHDYRYSVTSLTDSSGNIVAAYDYKVYGNREGNTTLTDIGYTGQRHDPESGLMYFRNRYYNPTTGSFTTKDPLGYVDGMSMYLGYFGGQGADMLGLYDLAALTLVTEALKEVNELIKDAKNKHFDQIAKELKKTSEGLNDLAKLNDFFESKQECESCNNVWVTIVIEEPAFKKGKLLDRKGMSGHTGIGINSFFYDFGPQNGRGGNPFGSRAQPWWDSQITEDGQELDLSIEMLTAGILLGSIGNNHQPIHYFGVCVLKSKGNKVKEYWDNLYKNMGRYTFYCKQCTSTVGKSLRKSSILDVQVLKPISLLKKIRKQLKHEAGAKKGQEAEEIIVPYKSEEFIKLSEH